MPWQISQSYETAAIHHPRKKTCGRICFKARYSYCCRLLFSKFIPLHISRKQKMVRDSSPEGLLRYRNFTLEFQGEYEHSFIHKKENRELLRCTGETSNRQTTRTEINSVLSALVMTRTLIEGFNFFQMESQLQTHSFCFYFDGVYFTIDDLSLKKCLKKFFSGKRSVSRNFLCRKQD